MSKIAGVLKAMAQVKTPKLVDNPKKEGIPPFLQTENRDKVFKEVPEEAKKKMALAAAYEKTPWGKPKGMSNEEYDAHLSRERQAKAAAQEKRAAKEVKPKKEQPKDAFALRDWARKNNLDPRHVRAAARANKDKLKSLEVAKHTFPNKIEEQVAKIIRDALKSKPPAGKKKSDVPELSKHFPIGGKSEEKKIPPGAVFTGKAKKAKKPEPAPVVGKKAKDRAELDRLMPKIAKRRKAK